MKEIESKQSIMIASASRLRESGHKLTPQRYMILSVIEEAHEHLCLEQIVHRVQECNPQVNQTTIYRNLFLLQELNVIRPTYFPGKSLCYEIVSEREHHHFLCMRCQAILHLDHHLLTDLFDELQTLYHIHDLSLGLLDTGYCDDCWQTVQLEKERMVHKIGVEK